MLQCSPKKTVLSGDLAQHLEAQENWEGDKAQCGQFLKAGQVWVQIPALSLTSLVTLPAQRLT